GPEHPRGGRAGRVPRPEPRGCSDAPGLPRRRGGQLRADHGDLDGDRDRRAMARSMAVSPGATMTGTRIAAFALLFAMLATRPARAERYADDPEFILEEQALDRNLHALSGPRPAVVLVTMG